jgi:hypothetical protein
MKNIIITLVLLFIGCGTIKETSTTITAPVTVPPIIIHDTVYSYLEWKKEGYAFVNLDSVKHWTLENLCKGTVNIDTEGIKIRVSYSWQDVVSNLSDSLDRAQMVINDMNRMIEQQKIDLIEKERIIQGTKTVIETKETPGDWWIFFASLKFSIPIFIFGIITGLIVLPKIQAIKKFLP